MILMVVSGASEQGVVITWTLKSGSAGVWLWKRE